MARRVLGPLASVVLGVWQASWATAQGMGAAPVAQTASLERAIVEPVPSEIEVMITCEDLDGDGVSGAAYLCGPQDCDDSDPAIWRLITAYGDLDGDLYVSSTVQSICIGDTTPANVSFSPGEDCNDDRAYSRPDLGYCPTYDPLVKWAAAGYWAADFALHLDGGRQIHHWYTRYPPGTDWRFDADNSRDFGYESTSDLLGWSYGGGILDIADSGGWDDQHVWAPTVVRHPADGRYYMFYTGVTDVMPVPGKHYERIGIAVSDDLKAWSRLPLNACAGTTGDGCVFDCNLPWTAWSDTTLSWTHQCRDPHVARDEDGTFYMVYATAPAPFNWNMVVGLAASQELLNWTDLGPIPPTLGGVAESPHLFKRNGLYYLFWTYGRDGGLRYATTPDPAAGPWSAARTVPDTGWWKGAIASEILDAGDRLLLVYVHAAFRYFAFRALAFREDGLPVPGPAAPLNCLVLAPASVNPAAMEVPNGLDDDCDGYLDIVPDRAALLSQGAGTALVAEERLASWLVAWDGTHPGQHHRLEALPYPAFPWTGGNRPGDYWRLWVGSACNPDTAGIACLDTLASRRRLLVVTHDATASDLLPDTDEPDASSPLATPENCRAQYRALRDLFDARPDLAFVVWTPPPRHRSYAPPEGEAVANATRAAELAEWLREEWLREDGQSHPNIRVFDARAVTADTAGLFLRPEYERDVLDGADSLPNSAGIARLVPLLGQEMINALSVLDGGETCVDRDGDGFGDPANPICLNAAADCADENPLQNPGVPELCGNELDENCDGLFQPSCLRHQVLWLNEEAQIMAMAPGSTTPPGSSSPTEPDAARAPSCWATITSGPTGAAIGFALPAGASVRLDLYNVRGEHVARLAEGWRPAGEHVVSWNGRDRHGRTAAAGVYFALLEAGGRRARTRLALLR